MSHFLTAVIVDELEDHVMALEPYGEESEEYFEQANLITREAFISLRRDQGTVPTSTTDDEVWSWAHDNYGYVTSGTAYDYYNPAGRWDWWVMGGRFVNSLRIKPGCDYYLSLDQRGEHTTARKGQRADAARIRDIDWGAMAKGNKALRETASTIWDKHMADANYKLAYKLKWGTKKNFVDSQVKFCPCAVLLPDGEWLDDIDADLFYDIIRDPDLQDKWLCIIDCHIQAKKNKRRTQLFFSFFSVTYTSSQSTKNPNLKFKEYFFVDQALSIPSY